MYTCQDRRRQKRRNNIKTIEIMDDNMLPYILDRRDDCRHRGSKGMAATGIGLAAGLGGGALLFAIAGLWGMNKASEARSAGATQGLAGVTTALAALNGHMANERASREAWQAANAPSIRNYVDVSNTPVAASTSVSSAVADALALAAALNNSGNALNSAIGQESFLRVQRYSAPQPCGCDTCSCGS